MVDKISNIKHKTSLFQIENVKSTNIFQILGLSETNNHMRTKGRD
jgi:hypothetical protein